MGLNVFANYGNAIKGAPKEIIFNRTVLLSSLLYALGAVPLTWDQGSSAVLSTLPSFQKHFGIDSGSNAGEIRNFVSLVGIGDTVGAAISFFINDRLGRLWSYRLYIFIWAIGQFLAIFAPNLAALYASRIITGIGLGGLIVICPVAIVEIAPAEIRGILTSWYVVAMGFAHGISSFCVYGVYTNPHLQDTKLQFQVVWAAPVIFMGLCVAASFFLSESPRWLFLKDRQDDAVQSLVKLRGLPSAHPRVQQELHEIYEYFDRESAEHGGLAKAASHWSIIKETFTVPANLRRVQQILILYSLPQLSGASAVSSYFVPVLKIIGVKGDASHKIFLTGMYTISKFFFALIASFFFIDALGRRRSLFVGIGCQMLSDIYVGTYIKIQKDHRVPKSASQAALAAIFIQAFGYSVGLLTLPLVFAGELWPNRIRSFGCSLAQTFHRLFIYAMSFGLPSLLDKTHNWGAFIFFAGSCFVSLIYVYLVIPEVSGMSVEEIDQVFSGPWLAGLRKTHAKRQEPPRTSDSDSIESVLEEPNKPSVHLRE